MLFYALLTRTQAVNQDYETTGRPAVTLEVCLPKTTSEHNDDGDRQLDGRRLRCVVTTNSITAGTSR